MKEKFCFIFLSNPPQGFLLNSRPRKHEIRQISIAPEDINSSISKKFLEQYQLRKVSYLDLSKGRPLIESKAQIITKICPIPNHLLQSIVSELKSFLKTLPNPRHEEDELTPQLARRIIDEANTLMNP